MCFFGDTPKPKAPPPPVDNTKDNAASNAAAEMRRKQAALARGQGSTIMTSATGAPGAAPVAKPTLG